MPKARSGSGAGDYAIVRVAEGGEVPQRVELPENRAPFAVMLGGHDRRTLFIITAEWQAPTAPPRTWSG